MPRPSREELESYKELGATHVIVVCDSFSYEDYPVFVYPGESVQSKKSKYDGHNMQRIMEVIELQSELDARVAKVNADLRELQEEYKIAFEPTKTGFRARLLKDAKGKPKKRSSKAA